MAARPKVKPAKGPITKRISVKVNGVVHIDEVEPRLLLVYYLRDVVGLTGTHIGCDTSNCGACTVILDDGKREVTVKSCTMFAVQADGKEVTTVEGLEKDGRLNLVQEAFWENHALQCGFCTPGMVIQATWFLRNVQEPSEEKIREAMAGNICRCTGYWNIIKAVKAASAGSSVSSPHRRA